ncbi:MAG: ABC transporter substrate-binding protein [Gammaproteobacteria bacterium]|nr:ABC transporter substrate-binding protein [Gammaproteobacteria bacterium]
MKKITDHLKVLKKHGSLLTIAAILVTTGNTSALAEAGVNKDRIIIGGVMDLEGASQALGQGMKLGISTALSGKRVKGRTIEYITLNDSYNPTKTRGATEELIQRGVFALLGNVGTPTAAASLPVLADADTPAVGFFTGAGLLRPGKGDIVNYRASYVQETAAVISAGLQAGLKPAEICAYVQNDGYGMAGIAGVKSALRGEPGSSEIIKMLDQISSFKGQNPYRNGIGPVGVYTRNTFTAVNGYLSLKEWEAKSGSKCRLVVTVGAYRSIANFIGYAELKGEDWLYSAVSFTGAENLRLILADYNVTSNVIVTQVVPPLDSKLPIVQEARAALGADLSYVTLEGYIVGKFFLKVMETMPGNNITRSTFLSTIQGNTFDIGGVKLDFSEDNQGSDLVIATYLDNGAYQVIPLDGLTQLIR